MQIDAHPMALDLDALLMMALACTQVFVQCSSCIVVADREFQC